MGQQLIRNDKTGERAYWDGSKYVPLPQGVGKVIRNDKTGELRAWDGTKYAPIEAPHVPPPDALSNAMHITETGIMEGAGALAGIPRELASGVASSISAQPPGPIGRGPRVPGGVQHEPTELQQAIESALPTQEQATQAISEKSGVPIVHGQEPSGRILESTMAGATAGTPFGVAGAVGGALSGVGQQGAAELGVPPWLQNVAGLGLPLIAGGISTGIRAMTPSAVKQMGQALRGVTHEELFAAETAMRNAQQQGNPITWSEALNHVSNGRFPQLAGLQRVVEQSPGGAALNRVMTNRLEAARQQAEGTLNQVGPMPQGQALEAVPGRVQQSAQGVIEGERATTNELSRPAYEATTGTPTVTIPQPAFNRLLTDHPHLADAIAAVRRDPIAYGNLEGAADSSLTVLDAVKKHLDDLSQTARQQGARFAAENAGTLSNHVRDAMIAAEPRYASALNIQSIRQRHVEEPLRQGPVGQLAETPPTLAAQRGQLLPTGKQETVNPESVSATVTRLEQQAPGSAQNWLRANLQSQFDDVLKGLQAAGGDQSRGASLWANLVGNETKRANLQAYVNALDPSGATWNGFDRMLATLDAQRYRLPANSATAFNSETIKALQGKAIPLSMEDLNPIGLFSGEIKEAGRLRRYRFNSERLANLLVNPAARARLAELARINPNGREARRLFGSIVALSMSDPDQRQPAAKVAP